MTDILHVRGFGTHDIGNEPIYQQFKHIHVL
jgi:hypothetical protein